MTGSEVPVQNAWMEKNSLCTCVRGNMNSNSSTLNAIIKLTMRCKIGTLFSICFKQNRYINFTVNNPW